MKDRPSTSALAREEMDIDNRDEAYHNHHSALNGGLYHHEEEEGEPEDHDDLDIIVVQQILKGIEQLKKEKSRPSARKIVYKMKSLFSVDKDVAERQLDLAVRNGLVFKLHIQGGDSYFDPSALREHKNRRITVGKTKTDLSGLIVRIIREWCGNVSNGEGKELHDVENFISRTFDLTLKDGVDLRALLKEGVKKAVKNELLIADSKNKTFRLAPKAVHVNKENGKNGWDSEAIASGSPIKKKKSQKVRQTIWKQ